MLQQRRRAALGAALAGLFTWRHRTMTQIRMDAALRTVGAVTDQARAWASR